MTVLQLLSRRLILTRALSSLTSVGKTGEPTIPMGHTYSSDIPR